MSVALMGVTLFTNWKVSRKRPRRSDYENHKSNLGFESTPWFVLCVSPRRPLIIHVHVWPMLM